MMTVNRKKWLLACNRMLAGGLALLGFTGCTNETTEEYGMPHCTFQIKGKVSDQQEQLIEGARIIVRELRDMADSYYPLPDTLAVKSDGEYLYEYGGYPVQKVRVKCEDPSGAYQADSVDVALKYTGGSGNWNVGNASEEVNFTLKKSTDE
jgi:putative lipoprotein (rSAM/lipoprotein system)